MTEFTVKIAGYSIGIKSLYPETKALFNDYLTEERPLFTIETSEELIQKERCLMKRTDERNKLSVEGFSDSQIESNYLYRETAEQLSRYGVVLLHGSAIAVDGEAYIFVAPSGTGKSTHARFWRETFGERAVMINDDKPLVKCTDNGIFVCGSPWNGKHHLSTNITVPLKAVCFLQRGEENQIEQIKATDAFLPLLKAVYHSKTAEREASILKSLQSIRKQTSFFRLSCNMQWDAAQIAYAGMQGEEKRGIYEE